MNTSVTVSIKRQSCSTGSRVLRGGRLIYLSVHDAGRQFALHAAAVGRIHPQQKLPASGEGDGQRVKDLSGVDAGGGTVRNVISFIL